ncbi:MAG TPA: C-GCAxxG-C-C family protein [Anaerolineales bacterium]|nr:C-GCAxxG-C-C family protein [Anaerolineales bacterium]
MAASDRDQILGRLDAIIRRRLPLSGNCALVTFESLQEAFDLEDGAVIKALAPFPVVVGGGETCGVVTGALMAIGLAICRGIGEIDARARHLAAVEPALAFFREFERTYGSTRCADIVEALFGGAFDLRDHEQAIEWLSCGPIDRCGSVVERGARIAAESLLS